MVLRCSIVAASILFVLISTPAVVKGTCTIDCVCANSDAWAIEKNCRPMDRNRGRLNWEGHHYSRYSICNLFGCNCEKCETGSGYDNRWKTCLNPWELITGCVELVDGVCPTGECCNFGFYEPERSQKCCDIWPDKDGSRTVDQQQFCKDTRRMVDDEDKKEDDDCADFRYVRSLSADDKRNLLAEKYCLGADQVVRKDIFEVLLSLALSEYEGVDFSKAKAYIQNKGGIDQVLTCDLFNKSYAETDHLILCDNKQQHLDVMPASTKKGKKQKKTP